MRYQRKVAKIYMTRLRVPMAMNVTQSVSRNCMAVFWCSFYWARYPIIAVITVPIAIPTKMMNSIRERMSRFCSVSNNSFVLMAVFWFSFYWKRATTIGPPFSSSLKKQSFRSEFHPLNRNLRPS